MISRRTRRYPVAALLAAAIIVMAPAAAATRSDWRVLVAGNFRIYSTLSDGATLDVARQLSAFEKTVGKMLVTGDHLPDTPTVVYLLNERDFNRYAAFRPGLGGFFYPAPFENLMVVNAALPFKFVRVTLLHEFVHYIQRNTSTQNYPPWFTEGYAELFSGFSLDKGHLELGNLPLGVALYNGQWIPLERLLAVKQSDPEYQNERLAPEFYGEAWALVHYLLFDNENLQAATLRYLDNVDSGYPENAAFTDAFAIDKAELDRRLQAFVKRRVILVRKVELRDQIVSDSVPISRLSAAQADLEFTRLIWLLGRPPSTVDTLMHEALAQQPASIAARALAARIASARHEATDIHGMIDHYVAGGTDEPQVRIDLAATLLGADTDQQGADEARRILGDIAHADPPDIEAVMLWTQAAGGSHVSPMEIIEILKPVLTRAPHNTNVLRLLAQAEEQAGDKAAAREYYNRIILVSVIPEERRWAQKQADSRRLQP